MKKLAIILLMPALITARSSFGTVFGGSLVGSFAGSALSNAVFQPRQKQPQVVEKTVYVQQPQQTYQSSYSQDSYTQRQRELDLRERELALKERELGLRGN